MENILKRIKEDFLKEVLNGAKVIRVYDPGERGYVLLKRSEPTKEDGDEREFWFVMFEYSDKTNSHDLYHATDFIKMTDKQALKLAFKKFYNH